MQNPLKLLLALLCLPAIGFAQHEHQGHSMMGTPPAHRPDSLASMSIYQLGSTWRNESDQTVTIDTLIGRPIVLAMIYTSCTYVCPVIVEDMRRIEGELSESEREGVTFALFSFDPERDAPGALAAYRKQRSLGDRGWQLFTGATDDILELAAVLGVKYKKDGHGGYSHSNIITVLDAEGVVKHQQVGVRQHPAVSVAALRMLADPPPAHQTPAAH